jgi:hypothetical protein
MAITRCPYCHAIIDENDKYCNNCGTQLLFSEDEEIEEEIPGEKIVDAEVEEKDYTVDEPEDEKRPAPAKDLDSEIDEELAQELREETEEMALDELVAEEARKAGEDDVTEEVILVDEIEAAEAADKNDSKALVEEGPAGSKKPEPDADEDEEDEKDEEKEGEKEKEKDEDEDEDEDEEEELADELEDEKEDEAVEEEPEEGKKEPPRTGPELDAEEETREYAAAALKKAAEAAQVPEAPVPPGDEPVVEYVSEIAAPDEAATAGEAAFRPATFDTKEFENLGRTVELSKEKVDKLLEVLGEKRTPAPPSPAPPPPPALEPTPAAAPVPQTGSLPPWASTMKGAPVFAEDTGSVETRKFRGGEPATPGTEEEVEIFPRRRAADSTIGLPEKVSQSPLPFGAPAPEEEAEDGESGDEAAEEAKIRDLTPEKVVLPAGQVRSVRELGRAAAPGGEIEAPEEREEPEPRPPFSFSVFFKSKAFDVLFVGLFWLVALWLAASSLGVTLFAILGSMSGPMLLLYAAFILIYFFLFKFFLGETLGDRLFRPRE